MITLKRKNGRYIVEIYGLPYTLDTLHDALVFIYYTGCVCAP